MSTAIAEQLPIERKLYPDVSLFCSDDRLATPEQYARSLSTIRMIGHAVIEGTGLEAATRLGFDDFTTKISEMLKTDEEFGQEVDVNRDDRFFDMIDGQACNEIGVPMIEVVQKGHAASLNSSDSRIRDVQAIRDQGDVLIAERADCLKVGESMIAVSVEPIDQLSGQDAEFWRDMGYRPGIAYIQMYSRVDESNLAANAYSVDHSDLKVWIELMRTRGVDVPDEVDPNTFIRYTHIFESTLDEAKAEVAKLKSEHYEAIGSSLTKLDTKDIINQNSSFITYIYNAFYPEIGKAVVTQKNTETLRNFANQALNTINTEKLKPEIIKQLIRIANSTSFDDDMARVLSEDILPYATVENIRSTIRTKRSPETVVVLQNEQALVAKALPAEYQHAISQQMNQMALRAVDRGLAAGRSYGGCSGVQLTKNKNTEKIKDPMDIFGGNLETEKDNNEEDNGPDGLGPLRFKCTEGHWNTRQLGKLLEKCQHVPCKEGSVGCK